MRNFGLDLSRCLGIIMVLFAHSKAYFNPIFYKPLEAIGILGVELFFTLSGFLIGSIIIRELFETGDFYFLKRFYIRRFLRTLPLYFSILFFLFIFNKTFHWEYLLFLQNFTNSLFFFPETWSLSVEEWFYLLIPILFLLVSKVNNSKLAFISTCLVIIILEPILRFIQVIISNPHFVIGVRMQPFLRIDSLMFGVLFAGIKYYYSEIYYHIRKNQLTLLFFSIIGLIWSAFYFVVNFSNGLFDNTIFPRTIFLSLVPLFSIIFVISLESINFKSFLSKNNYFVKIITFISLTSYSTYLIHYGILKNLIKLKEFFPNYILLWILSIFSIYLISWILYKYLELPIIHFRNKITSKNKKIKIKTG